MSKQEFLRHFGIDESFELSDEAFARAMARYDREGAWCLTDVYWEALQEEFAIFSTKAAFVYEEMKRVREQELPARLCVLFADLLEHRAEEGRVRYPARSRRRDPAWETDCDMAIYFAQLSCARDMAAFHRRHGVPEEVIRNTLWDCFERGIIAHAAANGVDGFGSYSWNQLFVDYKILKIGIFNFEMQRRFTDNVRVYRNASGEVKILVNDRDVASDGQMVGTAGHDEIAFHATLRQSEEWVEGYAVDTAQARVLPELVRLNLDEWHLALKGGDLTVAVHLPAGEAFVHENMVRSYRECEALLARCYPQYRPKEFVCFSWLMDPQLRSLLKKDSNIVAFQSDFLCFPMKTSGVPALSSVFHRTEPPYEELPEKTSVQRSMKALYLQGGAIYMQGGVMFFDSVPTAE